MILGNVLKIQQSSIFVNSTMVVARPTVIAFVRLVISGRKAFGSLLFQNLTDDRLTSETEMSPAHLCVLVCWQ